MVSTDEIYREVMHIKRDVESVKHQTSWLLRSHASTVAAHWEKLFGILPGKKRRYNWMKVYLETNGKRSVRQIAEAAGVFEQDAGQWLIEMGRAQIVALLPQKKNDKVYEKTPADFSLGISERLRCELAKRSNIKDQADE